MHATGASSDQAELRTVMAERRKASLEGDTERIASSMADEYLQTDIFGEYFKPLAELVKSGKFQWEVFEEKDVQIRTYGDTAMVIGTLELKSSGARVRPRPSHLASRP